MVMSANSCSLAQIQTLLLGYQYETCNLYFIYFQQKLERHKIILKSNILKKRSCLERNIQHEIKEEMSAKLWTTKVDDEDKNFEQNSVQIETRK